MTKKALGPQQEAEDLCCGAAIESYTTCRQERFETDPDLCAGPPIASMLPATLQSTSICTDMICVLGGVNKPPQM